MNMAPVPGGDQPIRRLDTQVVNMVEEILGKMDKDNYIVMAGLITKLLDQMRGGEGDEEKNRHPRGDDT